MKIVLSSTYLIILIALTSTTYSQPPTSIIKEEWASSPILHNIYEDYKNESAIILMDKRRVEFIDEGKDVVRYRTLHRIIRVMDDRGIEAFNTIYLPITDNADIIDIKGRTILPDGRIIELNKNDIKDLKEKDILYKIFALEGLVKGCEIEFYYTYKTGTSFLGREVLQDKYPIVSAKFELVGPDRLIFETKSYNNLDPSRDTIIGEKRILMLNHERVPGLDEEKYSMYAANLKRVDFKLSYNKSRNTSERVLTWNELAKRAHSLNGVYSDKELKKIDGFISDLGWKKLNSDREKVIAVENYIKSNFSTRDDIDRDETENLEGVLKNKICSHRGTVRLISAVLSQLGVKYEFVLCGSRKDYTIDKAFENWNNYNNTLLYFPSLNKFISPIESEVRFPIFNPYWGGADGIYCKTTTIGNFTTAIASIKPIPLEDYTQSSSNIFADVRFNANMDSLIIAVKDVNTGYSSIFYRSAYNFNSTEDQRLITKDIIKNISRSETIIESTLENQGFEGYPDNKPVILSATVKSGDLIEKAGNKIILKVGELIGSQTEMYQEKPRQLSMELAYPHSLNRSIKLEIPEGYQVKNLKDLMIDKRYKDNGEEILVFVSSYNQEGNIIQIDIKEIYSRIHYSLAMYNDFQSIINAAADFNKIALVLEKK